VVKSLRKHTKGFFDCHLMVSHPEQWVDDFKNAGANNFTFHIEATSTRGRSSDAAARSADERCTTDDAASLCARVRESGMGVGVAIKPKTPVSAIESLLDAKLVDLVLVMTVEPGFGGQALIPDTLDKVRQVRERWPEVPVEVDGGLNNDTIDAAAEAGANVVVAGSAVLGAKDPAQAIAVLRESLLRHNPAA